MTRWAPGVSVRRRSVQAVLVFLVGTEGRGGSCRTGWPVLGPCGVMGLGCRGQEMGGLWLFCPHPPWCLQSADQCGPRESGRSFTFMV